MTKTIKILLTISLTSFALSLTGLLWGLFLPIGAIVFGLFMIFTVLGKEAAAFDEEQRLRASLADKNTSVVYRSSTIVRSPSVRVAAYH